jgi:hypothetical protein
MEDKVVLLDNGREVEAEDINTLGESSGLADDRVLAELLRMGTYTRVGVLPYAEYGSNPWAIVQIGATATARGLAINPFRAIVGPRADAAGDGKKLWRDIRSAISPMGASIGSEIALTANATGFPRWDLVYADVAVDVNVTDTRFRKDPSTEVVTPGPYVTKKQTTMSIAFVTGTPAASPVKPPLPADSGGHYKIPLAYVLVTPGIVTFLAHHVIDVAPVMHLALSTGACTLRPASSVSQETATAPWPINGTKRPNPFIPPSMVGGSSIVFGLDLRTAGSESHVNGDVIDNSVDWRNRFFKIMVQTNQGKLATDMTAPLLGFDPPGHNLTNETAATDNTFATMSNSIVHVSSPGLVEICRVTSTNISMLVGPEVTLQVDKTTGAMKLKLAGGATLGVFFFWVEATAQLTNFTNY